MALAVRTVPLSFDLRFGNVRPFVSVGKAGLPSAVAKAGLSWSAVKVIAAGDGAIIGHRPRFVKAAGGTVMLMRQRHSNAEIQHSSKDHENDTHADDKRPHSAGHLLLCGHLRHCNASSICFSVQPQALAFATTRRTP